jgi:hypothetical protein
MGVACSRASDLESGIFNGNELGISICLWEGDVIWTGEDSILEVRTEDVVVLPCRGGEGGAQLSRRNQQGKVLTSADL